MGGAGRRWRGRLTGVGHEDVPLGEGGHRVDRQDRVAADVRLAVVQARKDGRYEGLQDLLLVNAAEEAERNTSQVLVRVLEVVPQILANQDHLREELAIIIRLLDRLLR